jgi:hypothetical protein
VRRGGLFAFFSSFVLIAKVAHPAWWRKIAGRVMAIRFSHQSAPSVYIRNKHTSIRVFKFNIFLQLSFSSLFSTTGFDASRFYWKKSPKFTWGPKLEALTE